MTNKEPLEPVSTTRQGDRALRRRRRRRRPVRSVLLGLLRLFRGRASR